MSQLAESTPPPTPSHPCPDPHVTSIGHVLVCLDRSAAADESLPCARFVAEAFGSRITLLHVMPSPPGGKEAVRADALDWQLALREAEHYLSRVRDAVGVAPRGTVTRLVQGSPPEQIVAMARETGVDLTIMTSRGEGGRSANDLGSVAQRVLALAGGSVLLLPPNSVACVPPRRILVPLDGSLRSESVLPIVTQLAQHHAAEIMLVHVVTDPTSSAVLSNGDDMQLAMSLSARKADNAEEYLALMRARLLPQTPAVTTLVVRRCSDRQSLLDLSVEHGVDMVALTAHGSTCNPDRAFGSVATYLLAHAPLPILVLQDMPRALRGAERTAPVSPSTRPPSHD